MSHPCWSLSHLLTSHLPQHAAPPGQRDLFQEDTVHPEQLPREPPPKTSANAIWSESNAKESLSHPNYESARNLRNNTPTETGAESSRWLAKAAEWNPELSSKYRTNRAIGRPRKRWEDDINEFFKLEENEAENSIESNNQFNKSWINAAKDRGRWTLLENDYTTTAEERYEGNARARRNTQSRPAR